MPVQNCQDREDVERDGLPREVLEEGQTERDEDQRGHDGDACDTEGLAHELADQLPPVRSEGLPKRDLAVTRERTGGRHVHEVETGQQDDDDGQGAEQQQVRAVAVCSGLVLELGVEVDVGQRLHPEAHRDVLRFPPRAEPFFEHVRQFLREGDGLHIRRQQQVGIEGRPIPLLQVIISQDTKRPLDPEEGSPPGNASARAGPASPR